MPINLSTTSYVLAINCILPFSHRVLLLSNHIRPLRRILVISTTIFSLLLPNIIIESKQSDVINVFGKVFTLVVATKFLNLGLRVSGYYNDGLGSFLKSLLMRNKIEEKNMEKKKNDDVRDEGVDVEDETNVLKKAAPNANKSLFFALARVIASISFQYVVVNLCYLVFRYQEPQPFKGTIIDILFRHPTLTNPRAILQNYAYVLGFYTSMNILYYPFATLAALLLGSDIDSIPPVHNKPFLSTSLRDFWNRRWNVNTKSELRELVFLPVLRLLGSDVNVKKSNKIPQWKCLVAGLATFLYSGLMHEYIIWSFFGTVDGQQMSFFMLQGVGVIAEVGFSKLMSRVGLRRFCEKNGWWAGRIWAKGWLLWTSPLFLNGFIKSGAHKWRLLPLVIDEEVMFLK